MYKKQNDLSSWHTLLPRRMVRNILIYNIIDTSRNSFAGIIDVNDYNYNSNHDDKNNNDKNDSEYDDTESDNGYVIVVMRGIHIII